MSIQKNSDGIGDSKSRITSTQKRNQEINNPCLKEHILSLQCLNSNSEDHSACDIYFANYKNCKSFWAAIQSDRRSKGIKPYLPCPEERAKIKADFLNR